MHEINSEQVHFPGYSIIQQNTSIYQATVNTCLSQFIKDKTECIIFPESNQIPKSNTQSLRKISKSLLEYLILQGYFEFVLSIKIQNTQIYPRQKNILSTEYPILPARLHFQQNSTFSKLRLYYLEQLKVQGKNTL